MKYETIPQGVCARHLQFEIEDGIIRSAAFSGGCHGNLQGICLLIEGMKAEEVAAKLKGVCCGRKKTSCPDQLAKAIEKALAMEPAPVG
ncbi:MAG: TIGR03905 family TSCPD domain-containing protein [Clostridia bacterium]|nr:TIGR03905 family TSCPD domain-containing protein [Clostridia bacterium]